MEEKGLYYHTVRQIKSKVEESKEMYLFMSEPALVFMLEDELCRKDLNSILLLQRSMGFSFHYLITVGSIFSQLLLCSSIHVCVYG